MSQIKHNWLLNNKNDFCEGVSQFYKDVIHWNLVAGNNHLDLDNQEKLQTLYADLVDEEIKELEEAYVKGDAVGFCKELGDVLVVTSFATLVHNEIDKEDLINPDFVSTLNHTLNYTSNPLGVTVPCVYDMYYTELLSVYEALASDLDVYFVGILNEIIKSNFSKFISVHEAVTRWGGDLGLICKKIEENSNGRYSGVTSQESNGFIVFRDDKGKIMKPPTYFKADIKKHISEKWL